MRLVERFLLTVSLNYMRRKTSEKKIKNRVFFFSGISSMDFVIDFFEFQNGMHLGEEGPNWNEGSILVFVLPGRWRRLLRAASDRLTTILVGEAGINMLCFRSPQPPSNRPEAHAEIDC
jgi:hypothetical protein